MSTTQKPLRILWSAVFEDGHIIDQPQDDKYSKHDETAEWNPSSFRDLLEYEEISKLKWFHLLETKKRSVTIRNGHDVTSHARIWALNAQTGDFYLDGVKFRLDDWQGDRKLIYFRKMLRDNIDGEWQEPRVASYNFGYEYNENGKTVKRIITIDG